MPAEFQTVPGPVPGILAQRAAEAEPLQGHVEIAPVRLGEDGRPAFIPGKADPEIFRSDTTPSVDRIHTFLHGAGLSIAPGTTYLVPLSETAVFAVSFDLETDASFQIVIGKENLAVADAIIRAKRAALGTPATHVSIRLS